MFGAGALDSLIRGLQHLHTVLQVAGLLHRLPAAAHVVLWLQLRLLLQGSA